MNESFSYHRISSYLKCPFFYKLKYIEKCLAEFSDNSIFERGRYFHHFLCFWPKIVEFNFKFEENKLKKKEFDKFLNKLVDKKSIKFLLENSIKREEKFFLDENFEIINSYKDSFINGIIDLYSKKDENSMIIVDWKTGKTQKFADLDQLRLYSIYIFKKFPKIEKNYLYLYFIEQDSFKNEIVERKDLDLIKNRFCELINIIKNDKQFKFNPSSSCNFCQAFLENKCNPFKINLEEKKNGK